ncbi:MAG TPA: hypothetical protein VJ828_14665 [Lacipirellulaceae bacterium]|nr:hypothetical protein [Lacipirellulaceae bacterium]
MPDEFHATEFLPREFAPTLRDRQRWRLLSANSRSHRHTFRLLKKIEFERSAAISSAALRAAPLGWLLSYRDDLRWAIEHAPVEPIKLYLTQCPLDMVPIAVWLWGKCADRFRLYGLSGFCYYRSPMVRKHVAKALWRLEAWSLLDEMAAAFPDDEKIHWFASAPISHGPFEERLENFKRNVDDSHAGEVATPSRMPFWAAERVWDYTPPKSVALIRRMLQRIRHWVRWRAG